MFIRILTRSLIALIAIALFSCKQPARHAEQTSAAAPPAQQSGGDEPSNDLPPDLYANMPEYPGAKVAHVHKPQREMRKILFTADAPLDTLIDYYKDNLKKAGFFITSSLKLAARKTWSCDFQKDGRPGNIIIYPAQAGTEHMTIELLYVMPVKQDPNMLEPVENFDVVGPGPVTAQANQNQNGKRD